MKMEDPIQTPWECIFITEGDQHPKGPDYDPIANSDDVSVENIKENHSGNKNQDIINLENKNLSDKEHCEKNNDKTYIKVDIDDSKTLETKMENNEINVIINVENHSEKESKQAEIDINVQNKNKKADIDSKKEVDGNFLEDIEVVNNASIIHLDIPESWRKPATEDSVSEPGTKCSDSESNKQKDNNVPKNGVIRIATNLTKDTMEPRNNILPVSNIFENCDKERELKSSSLVETLTKKLSTKPNDKEDCHIINLAIPESWRKPATEDSVSETGTKCSDRESNKQKDNNIPKNGGIRIATNLTKDTMEPSNNILPVSNIFENSDKERELKSSSLVETLTKKLPTKPNDKEDCHIINLAIPESWRKPAAEDSISEPGTTCSDRESNIPNDDNVTKNDKVRIVTNLIKNALEPRNNILPVSNNVENCTKEGELKSSSLVQILNEKLSPKPNDNQDCHILSNISAISSMNKMPYTTAEIASKEKVNDKAIIEAGYNCIICGQIFQLRSQFMLHLAVHKKEQDTLMSKNQNLASTLSPKIMSVDNLHSSTESSISPPKIKESPGFNCIVCGLFFQEKNSLFMHLETHKAVQEPPQQSKSSFNLGTTLDLASVFDLQGSSVDNSILQTAEFINSLATSLHIDGNDETGYNCMVCGVFFQLKTQLLMHMRSHKDGNLLSCTDCGKKFRQLSNLLIHKRCHTGERPFECQLCGKKFTQTGNLKLHLRIHTGIKPFECTDCGKKFYQKGNLKEHLKTHTGEKPYKCPICGKLCAHKSGYRYHLSIHTGKKTYDCFKCGKQLSYKKALIEHLKTHADAINIEQIQQMQQIQAMKTENSCFECGKQCGSMQELQIHMATHINEFFSSQLPTMVPSPYTPFRFPSQNQAVIDIS